jgi:hypothetical protein
MLSKYTKAMGFRPTGIDDSVVPAAAKSNRGFPGACFLLPVPVTGMSQENRKPCSFASSGAVSGFLLGRAEAPGFSG